MCKSDELQTFSELHKAIKDNCKRRGLLEAIQEAEENPHVTYTPDVAGLKAMGAIAKKAGAKTQEGMLTWRTCVITKIIKYRFAGEAEETLQEEEEVKKTPQRKSKTPKSEVQKRPVKIEQDQSEDEESSDDAPVPTKKMRKSTVGLPPTNKNKLRKPKELPSDEESDATLSATVTELLPKGPAPITDKPAESKADLEDLFVQYLEPEDDNMPEDERIVRRLIKSAVWESIDDENALEIILRRMRQNFSDDKIKNWDQSELLESIEAERTRSKEKIQECCILKDQSLMDVDEIIQEENMTNKKVVSDDSEDEDEKVWQIEF